MGGGKWESRCCFSCATVHLCIWPKCFWKTPDGSHGRIRGKIHGSETTNYSRQLPAKTGSRESECGASAVVPVSAVVPTLPYSSSCSHLPYRVAQSHQATTATTNDSRPVPGVTTMSSSSWTLPCPCNRATGSSPCHRHHLFPWDFFSTRYSTTCFMIRTGVAKPEARSPKPHPPNMESKQEA